MLTGSIAGDIKHQFRYGNMVMKLIFVNLGVFLLMGLLKLICFFAQNDAVYDLILAKLQMPASSRTLLYQPWAFVSYMFLHIGFLHVLFNMLWLFWFGEIFVLHLGDKKILPLYLIGGISGALIYVLCYNLIPVFKPQVDFSLMLGASASVFAIVFAAATINPNYEIGLMFIGPVKIKYIAIISLLLDVINIPYGNAGGYLAHVGGALSGYLYISALQNGTDIFSPIEKLKGLFTRKTKVRVAYKNTAYQKTEKPIGKSEQQRVDEILDKIARSGYDSLNKEEKDFLFHYSKK